MNLVFDHSSGEIIVLLPNFQRARFSRERSDALFEFCELWAAGHFDDAKSLSAREDWKRKSRSAIANYEGDIKKIKKTERRKNGCDLSRLLSSMTESEKTELLRRLEK